MPSHAIAFLSDHGRRAAKKRHLNKFRQKHESYYPRADRSENFSFDEELNFKFSHRSNPPELASLADIGEMFVEAGRRKRREGEEIKMPSF